MGERSVQAKLLPHLLDVSRWRREITDQRLHRVTGHNVQDQEIEDNDSQHDRNCPKKPHQQIATHQATFPASPLLRRRVSMRRSSNSSSRAMVAVISLRRDAPSTGSIRAATLSASSLSLSGFCGAPLANCT